MLKSRDLIWARPSRRDVLKTAAQAAGGTAFLAMAPSVLRAQARSVKIGLVTPTTGPLAFFAEADAYVLDQFRKTVAGGIKIGTQTNTVEVIVKEPIANRVASAGQDGFRDRSPGHG